MAEAGAFSAVLVLGGDVLPATGPARKVVVTAGAVPDDETVDVVLPVAHQYEQAGSLTNLEGRVQPIRAGGMPPHGVPADWQLVATLVQKLGGSAPSDLKSIRAALAGAHPSYALTQERSPRVARLLLPLA